MDNLTQLFDPNANPPSQIAVPFSADEARSEIQKTLRGKKWTEVTLQMLRDGCSCPPTEIVSSLTPDAFFYYLPALLRLCIEEPGKVDCLPESVFGSLERHSTTLLEKPWLLTLEQRKVVLGYFLDYFKHGRMRKDANALSDKLLKA